MIADSTKLILDVGSASSVAIKVVQRLKALAKELHLEDYLVSDSYARKVKPSVPETGSLDATRRYDMLSSEFKAEVEALRKLREAAEQYLTVPAYEQLCVMMGRSTSECLEAKEIIDGVKVHFATLTRSEAESIVGSLQVPWTDGASLTKHVVAQASKVADLRAGGRGMADDVGKATLWRSLARVKQNPVYSGLTDTMSVLLDKEDVTFPIFVSKLLSELKKEQYFALNAESKAEAASSEVVLALKEKQTREERLKEKQRENKVKYAAHPLEDQCPVHANNEHTWGSCSHYTGKKYFAGKKK